MKIRINDGSSMMWDSSPKCNCEKGDSVMVFIDVQEIGDVYNTTEAYKNGTLYPELNKPFFMGGCLRYE